MPKLSFYTTTLTLLLTSVVANDLIFVAGPACNLAIQHVQCGSAQQGGCCTAQRPFCGRLFCRDCQTGNDLYAFYKQSCRGNSYGSCREQGRGSYCCLDLGEGDGCAGQWNTGGARKRSIGSSSEMKPSEECKVEHHPNKMVYLDAKGERREIYMPARDFYKAVAHFSKGEWDELAKFPKWENQQYTDADNLKNITDPKAFYSVPPPEKDEDDDASQTADGFKENDVSEKK